MLLAAALLTLPPAAAPRAAGQKQPVAPPQPPVAVPAPLKADAVQQPGTSESDAETLKAAELANNGPALIEFFKQRTVGEAEREKIIALIRKQGDDAFEVREGATEALVRYGPAAVGLLRQGNRDADVEVARRCERCLSRIEKVSGSTVAAAAARMIAVHKPAGSAEALLAFLPQADDELVADEVRTALAAVALRDGQPEPVLLAATADPLPVRRGAAIDALVRSGYTDARPLARKMLAGDKDLDVRLRVALALVTAAKDKPSVAPMINMLAELTPNQAWQAEEVLCQLAGDKAPRVPLGVNPQGRKDCRDAWMDWWEQNGEKADLAKLDDAERILGYTLLLEMDNNGQGRARELSRDGKERWKVTGLQFPIDAQILPNNRILIAEHNSHQVTERNLQGEVLWRKPVQLPVGVQRLANGNTFIACRNQLLEVDRDGKEVFSIPRANHDIVAARKSRSGEIVYATNQGSCVKLDANNKEVKSFNVGRLNYYSGIDLLPNGRILLTQLRGVAEFDPESGDTKWSVNVMSPNSVMRLPNGNTLVSSMNTLEIQELDRDGKKVWDFKADDGYRPWRVRRR
jgi:HEAT repeat protein